jgi:hypothetical protein
MAQLQHLCTYTATAAEEHTSPAPFILNVIFPSCSSWHTQSRKLPVNIEAPCCSCPLLPSPGGPPLLLLLLLHMHTALDCAEGPACLLLGGRNTLLPMPCGLLPTPESLVLGAWLLLCATNNLESPTRLLLPMVRVPWHRRSCLWNHTVIGTLARSMPSCTTQFAAAAHQGNSSSTSRGRTQCLDLRAARVCLELRKKAALPALPRPVVQQGCMNALFRNGVVHQEEQCHCGSGRHVHMQVAPPRS